MKLAVRPTAAAQRRLSAVAAFLIALVVLAAAARPLAAANDTIRIELNAAESADAKCRVSFVIQNSLERAVDSLKLDLAIFGSDGGLRNRLIIDMGPVRVAKTIVKTFILDIECGQIGSVLVNDVTACSLGEPGVCLDKLDLSSRLPNIRLYK